MHVIHKCKFVLTDYIDLPLPVGAKILSIQKQNGEWCVWYLFEYEKTPVINLIRVIGTGHDIDSRDVERLEFIATVQDGPFVWHFFRVL